MNNMMEGLSMTVVGIGTVFAILLVLAIVVSAMKKVFYKEAKAATPVETETVETVPVDSADETDDVDEEELVAVLTAAIASSLNQSTYNLRIKSFRRVNQTSPVWNAIGRKEQLENNL